MQERHALSWRGRWMMDGGDNLIGIIRDIYLENETDEPRWAAVGTSRIGWRTRLVPIEEATLEDNKVRVPYDREQVRSAPQIEGDELSPEDEALLSSHYGLEEPSTPADTPARPTGAPSLPEPSEERPAGLTVASGGDTSELARASQAREPRDEPEPPREQVPDAAPAPEAVGPPVGLSEDDRLDLELILAEEELHIERDVQQISRAFIRKHVDVERLQTTVEVRREQLRVDREPINEADIDELSLQVELTDQEFEVALFGEQVRVERRVMPRERVRVHKEVSTEQITLDEPVRRERLSVDTDGEAQGTSLE